MGAHKTLGTPLSLDSRPPRPFQYGLEASLALFSCTFSRLVPIWNPFIADIASWADAAFSNDTKPKHFDRLVCLSMNTLADITGPKGRNVDAKSMSVNSWGRW